MLNFVSILSNRLVVVAAVYQTEFALALSITMQALKQALIPIDFDMQKW